MDGHRNRLRGDTGTLMALRYPANSILIRCPNWIGDAVAATATIRCMRRNYPHARIDLLASPYVRPAVENAPWFNEIIEVDRQRGGLGSMFGAIKELRRREPYHLALLMTHSFSSAFIVWRGRAVHIVGHARNGRSCMLTDAVPWPKKSSEKPGVPKVEIYASLLEYLGCDGARDQHPEVFTSEEDEKAADRLLEKHGCDPARKLVAIVPGAAYGASKLWDPRRFSAVIDVLAGQHGFQAIILTGPGEAIIGQEIASHVVSQTIVFKEGETSFGILKAIVRRCALMICNDTGPRHVGIAYNIPVVCLMGPTDPIVTHSDYERTIILRQDVPCGPCYKRVCPTDHICMDRITTEMVLDAALQLMERYPV